MSAKKRAGIIAALLLPVASPAAHAGAVMLWNDTLLSIAQQTSGLLTNGPPEIAREIAMVDTAMYDAANAATGQTYKPYAYAPGPMHASPDAAALQAGFTVMQSIFSNPIWGAPVSASVLPQITQAYTAGLASLPPGTGTTLGLSIGAAAGDTMVALRANDGATAAIEAGLSTFIPPGSGSVPGVYIPPANRPAMFPTWGSVTPFTMTSSSQFPVPPAPTITSAGYAASILETECLGTAGSLSGPVQSACAAAGGDNNFGLQSAGKVGTSTGSIASNAQVALFWNDPGGTLTPPGHWLQIADEVLQQQGVTDELQQARLGAMLGTAEADAGIAAWETKYLPFPTGTLWRPNSAIQDCNSWNALFTTCDPAWTSLIATPPHPDYLAGHPTFSEAAATVLDDFFGTDDISFCSTSLPYTNAGAAVPPITLCYDGFLAASSDATISRIYGGIHTTYAVFNAQTLGAEIADNLIAHNFTPVGEPSSFALLGVGLAGLLAGRRVLMRRRISSTCSKGVICPCISVPAVEKLRVGRDQISFAPPSP